MADTTSDSKWLTLTGLKTLVNKIKSYFVPINSSDETLQVKWTSEESGNTLMLLTPDTLLFNDQGNDTHQIMLSGGYITVCHKVGGKIKTITIENGSIYGAVSEDGSVTHTFTLSAGAEFQLQNVSTGKSIIMQQGQISISDSDSNSVVIDSTGITLTSGTTTKTITATS